MVILYMVFLLPLTIDAYHLAGYDHYCSVPSTRIRTRADCQAAAAALGLAWGNGWWGPNDFAACLYTKDPRKKVYFNYSHRPSSTPNNPNYAEICTGPGLPKHYGLVITGGDDPQRQELSELVSHLGICGSPNIPDLPNAISAGKSVWFEDWLMFCGGSDTYIGGINDPTGWGAIKTCLKTKPGHTVWESNLDFNMNHNRSWFSLNINEKNNGVPTVVAAGGLDPLGNIWNTLEQYKKGQWHMKTSITLNYKVYGHCGVQYTRDEISWLMLIAGSNKFNEWWDPTDRITEINLDNGDQNEMNGLLPALWAPACTIHGENIYITGGGTKSRTLPTADPTDGVYIYNIHTGMTKSTGVLNIPRWGHTMGVTAKNQLVVAGGWNGARLTSVEVSEDGGKTWKKWSTVLSKGAEYTAMASVPIEYLMCQ